MRPIQTLAHQGLPTELRAFAEKHLGVLREVRFCGQPHAESGVWALTGERQAFLKALKQPGKFRQELHAYSAWLPLLEPRVPQRSSSLPAKASGCSFTSGLPGEILEDAQLSEVQRRDAYFQAGMFLRDLHRLPLTGRGNDSTPLAKAYWERAQSWLARAEGIVEPGICDWVSDRVADVAEALGAPTIRSVPCHLDYTGRNWLVSTTGERGKLSVIDFEHSRPDFWLGDIEKLNLDGWGEGLEEAFWQGYGTQPTAAELALADKLAVFAAFRVIVWAREHRYSAFEAKGWRRLRELRAKLG